MSKLKALRSMMNRYLSIDDIKNFCFDEGFEFGDLEEGGKQAKIRSLLLKLDRESKLSFLQIWLVQNRPDQDWNAYFDMKETSLTSSKDNEYVAKQSNLPLTQINHVKAEASQINQITGDNTNINFVTNVTHKHGSSRQKRKKVKQKRPPVTIDFQKACQDIVDYFRYFTVLLVGLVISVIFSVYFTYTSMTRNPESISFLVGILITLLFGALLINSKRILFNFLDRQVRFWDLDIKVRRQIKDLLIKSEALNSYQLFQINRFLYVNYNDAKRYLRGPLSK